MGRVSNQSIVSVWEANNFATSPCQPPPNSTELASRVRKQWLKRSWSGLLLLGRNGNWWMISLETLVESTWQDGYQLWQLNALQSQPKTNIWKIGNSSKNFGECDDLMTCIVQASWIAELHASTLLELKFQAKYEWRSIFGLGICSVVQIWSTLVPYVCWRNAAGAEMDPSAFAGCLQCSITS